MKAQFVYRENGEIVERGFTYEVLSTDNGWFRIVDDMGEKCYYPASLFDIVDPDPPAPEIHYTEDDLDETGTYLLA